MGRPDSVVITLPPLAGIILSLESAAAALQVSNLDEAAIVNNST